MPTTTIPKDSHIKVGYRVPRDRVVSFHVEAEAPVTTYVLDAEGLKEFYSGQGDVYSVGGFTNRKVHDQEIRLPFSGRWYLIVMNRTGVPVAVFYEVYS